MSNNYSDNQLEKTIDEIQDSISKLKLQYKKEQENKAKKSKIIICIITIMLIVACIVGSVYYFVFVRNKIYINGIHMNGIEDYELAFKNPTVTDIGNFGFCFFDYSRLSDYGILRFEFNDKNKKYKVTSEDGRVEDEIKNGRSSIHTFDVNNDNYFEFFVYEYNPDNNKYDKVLTIYGIGEKD